MAPSLRVYLRVSYTRPRRHTMWKSRRFTSENHRSSTQLYMVRRTWCWILTGLSVHWSRLTAEQLTLIFTHGWRRCQNLPLNQTKRCVNFHVNLHYCFYIEIISKTNGVIFLYTCTHGVNTFNRGWEKQQTYTGESIPTSTVRISSITKYTRGPSMRREHVLCSYNLTPSCGIIWLVLARMVD